VPSIDPKTGKRYSGAQQRAQAAARQGLSESQRRGITPAKTALVKSSATAESMEYPPPVDLINTPPPPDTVDAIEAWAAAINIRAAIALRSGTDTARLVVVCATITYLSKMNVIAGRAEKVITLQRMRQLVHVDTDPTKEPPYSDTVALTLWAYRHLALLVWEAAVSVSWEPDGRIASARALAAQIGMPAKSEIERRLSEIERGG
jgi:hypothetical protein